MVLMVLFLRKPEDVCRKKYGDCKDMALLLFTLLKSAGIGS
jgi:transglutaminase-like putative cysteine protease